MRKRMRVYICDFCGAVAPEATYGTGEGIWHERPPQWVGLGRMDLCRDCYQAYIDAREAIEKENCNDE